MSGCRRAECVQANATYARNQLQKKRPTKLPVKIRRISDVELAWLAGLLEGEGSFMFHCDPAKDNQRARVIVRVAVHMTDKDVVERVRDIVGVGNVLPRKPGKAHHKVTYRWALSAKAAAIDLMTLLRPHMGERRRAQIDACIEAVTENGGLRTRERHHGESLYWAGCRCEVCCQAKRQANARRYTEHVDVAQLVEHHVANVGVAGS